MILPPMLKDKDGRVRGRNAMRMLKAQCKRIDRISAQGESEAELAQHFRIEARAGRCQVCMSQQVPTESAGERDSLRFGGVAVDLTCAQLSPDEVAPVRIGVRQGLQWLAAPALCSGEASTNLPRIPLASVYAFDDTAPVGQGADRSGEAPGVGLFLLAGSAWLVGCAAYACCQVPDIPMVSPDLFYQQVLRRIENIPVSQESPQFAQYKQYYMRQYHQHAQDYAALQSQYQHNTSFMSRFDVQAFLHGLAVGLLLFAAVLAYCEYHHGTISCWMELAEECWLAWRERLSRVWDPMSDPSNVERLLKEMGEEQEAASSSAQCGASAASGGKASSKTEKPKADASPAAGSASPKISSAAPATAAGANTKRRSDAAEKAKAEASGASLAPSLFPATASTIFGSAQAPTTQKVTASAAAQHTSADAKASALVIPRGKAKAAAKGFPSTEAVPPREPGSSKAPAGVIAVPEAVKLATVTQGHVPSSSTTSTLGASAEGLPLLHSAVAEVTCAAAELELSSDAATAELEPTLRNVPQKMPTSIESGAEISSDSPDTANMVEEGLAKGSTRRKAVSPLACADATKLRPCAEEAASDFFPPLAAAIAATPPQATGLLTPSSRAAATPRSGSAGNDLPDAAAAPVPRARATQGTQYADAVASAGGSNVRERLRRKVVERQRQQMQDIVASPPAASTTAAVPIAPAPAALAPRKAAPATAASETTAEPAEQEPKRGLELLREAEELLCQLEQEELLRQLEQEEQHRGTKRATRKKTKQRKATEVVAADAAKGSAQKDEKLIGSEDTKAIGPSTHTPSCNVPEEHASGRQFSTDQIQAIQALEFEDDDEEPQASSSTTTASERGKDETAPGTSEGSECASVTGVVQASQASEGEEGQEDEAKEHQPTAKLTPEASPSLFVSPASSRRWADISAMSDDDEYVQPDDSKAFQQARQASVHTAPDAFIPTARASSHRQRKKRGMPGEAKPEQATTRLSMTSSKGYDAAATEAQFSARKAGACGPPHHRDACPSAAAPSHGRPGDRAAPESQRHREQHQGDNKLRGQPRGGWVAASREGAVQQKAQAAASNPRRSPKSWAAVVGNSPIAGSSSASGGPDAEVQEAVSMVLEELGAQSVSSIEDFLRHNSAGEWYGQRVETSSRRHSKADLLALAEELLLEQFSENVATAELEEDAEAEAEAEVGAEVSPSESPCTDDESFGIDCSHADEARKYILRADAPEFIPGVTNLQEEEMQQQQQQFMCPVPQVPQVPQQVFLFGPFPVPQGMSPPPAMMLDGMPFSPDGIHGPMLTPVLMAPGNMCSEVSTPVPSCSNEPGGTPPAQLEQPIAAADEDCQR